MGAHPVKVNLAPDYTGVQLQTSAMSLPVPLAWGLTRGAPNLIDYTDFQVKKVTVGKGGALGKTQQDDYRATIVLALCEGPINDITKTYLNQGFQTGYGPIGFSLFKGTTPQSPWSYMVTNHPDHALSYQGVCYLAHPHFDMGASASLPAMSFEVQAPLYNTGYTGDGDADCALVVQDFLTNEQYGTYFPTSRLDLTALLSGPDATTTGDSAYQTYCRAMSFGLAPFLQNQEQASSILARWCQITNTAPCWTGYSLKLIPFGDLPITANGVTYLPPTDLVFAFGDDDYIQDKDTDPVRQTIRDWFDAYNALAIECRIREYEYNNVPIDWIDQSMSDLVGRRQAPTMQAHEICETTMAKNVVSLVGARMLYVRSTYLAKFGPEWATLEPMDCGTLNEPLAGIFNQPVRIQDIEEQDDGSLSITFEEFPGTTGAHTGLAIGGPAPIAVNTQVAPDPVNPPIIFEPNSQAAAFLNGGSAAPIVIILASGGAGGIADPTWGGYIVNASTDGTTYVPLGTMEGAARMGVLTSTLATYGGANPDTGHTLAVDLSESGGELISASSGATAAAGATLCYVDGELIGPQTAILTGANAYGLTNLYRGLFGTTIGAHASSSQFGRLDNAMFIYALPPAWIGVPLKFKLQSFNIWGQGLQDISTCVEYDYTPTGAGSGGGGGGVPTTPTGLTAATSDPQGVQLAWAANPVTDNVTGFRLFRAPGAGASFGAASLIATVTGQAYTDSGLTAGAAYTYFLEATNAVGSSSPTSGVDGIAGSTAGGASVVLFNSVGQAMFNDAVNVMTVD
jgi:hypothetical protein